MQSRYHGKFRERSFKWIWCFTKKKKNWSSFFDYSRKGAAAQLKSQAMQTAIHVGHSKSNTSYLFPRKLQEIQ